MSEDTYQTPEQIMAADINKTEAVAAAKQIIEDYKKGRDKVDEIYKDYAQEKALEYTSPPKSEHPSLANYAGLLCFIALASLGIGVLIGYNIAKPTPTIFNLSIYRLDREPLVIPIRTQQEANWFLPVGTNPVVVTRISLDKPTTD